MNNKNFLISNMIAGLKQRDKIYCYHCGEYIWANLDTCPHCNARIITQSDNSNISPEISAKTDSIKTDDSTLSTFWERLKDVIGSLFACAFFLVIGSWIPMILSSEDAGKIAIAMIAGDYQGKPFSSEEVKLPEKSEEIKTKTGLTLYQYNSIFAQPPRSIINSCGIMICIGSKCLALFRSDYLFDACIVQFILLILAVFSLIESIVNIWLVITKIIK